MKKLTEGTVSPAYGRDYNNKADAEIAFREGKDFKYHSPFGSGYCSIRDFEPGAMVKIRYKKMQQVHLMQV
jgi:hypothetical protein